MTNSTRSARTRVADLIESRVVLGGAAGVAILGLAAAVLDRFVPALSFIPIDAVSYVMVAAAMVALASTIIETNRLATRSSGTEV